MGLLSWLNPLESIARELGRAYAKKQDAKTDSARIEAETRIATLEAQRDVLIAEQGSWLTRWIRPALALPVVVFVWKIVLWDTVLGLGVTPDPGELVRWIVVTTIGAFLLTRPLDKWLGRRR